MGLSPEDFYSRTVYELTVMLKGQNKKKIHDKNKLTYVAYYVALFNRQKKLPSLSDVLDDENRTEEKKEQTPEEILSIIKVLNAALGGDEVQI